jgi:hypothetical protein
MFDIVKTPEEITDNSEIYAYNTWGKFLDSMNISAEESSKYHRISCNKPWLDKEYSTLVEGRNKTGIK